ncbi:MAG: permease-like cell division protein FtsX [Paludibacter sp.]|nr:permease-like cell division protein FtsX [Paludibacter sp.]
MSIESRKTRKPGFWNLHLTSTISMSLVLFLVGLVCMLLFVAHDLSIYVKENINLSIILDDNINSNSEQRIQTYLLGAPFTKSVEYISKDDALKDHIANLGENPEDFLGYNPLLASLEVKLNAVYANNDSVNKIESKLKAFKDIKRVVYQKDIVSLVNENVSKMSLVLMALAAILLFVSVALINNTVRLSLYSNRFLINTMKLVGATPWFIRRPYIISSMINGVVASVISLFLLFGVINFIQFQFGMTGMIIQPLTAVTVSSIVILLGVSLAAISSFFAVGRYLKMNTNDMYFI